MSTTVLVVEDNPANMRLAVLLLTNAGYHVLTETSAEAGLAAFYDQKLTWKRAFSGLEAAIDIATDGLAAITQLRRDELTRSIPVIALTALAMKGDEERIRAAGFDAYIGKPMRYKEFLASVAALLPGVRVLPSQA